MNTKNEIQKQEQAVEATRALARFTPRCDIWEDRDGVHVVAEMPGVDPGTVDVTLERNVLTVTGRAPLPAPEGRDRIYAEFQAGEYQRSFQLSGLADAEGIQARCKDGLLTVLVPKKKPAQRRITVATS